MHIGPFSIGGKVSLMWISRAARNMPLRMWLFTTAHDSSSRFWRILGLEINIPIEPVDDEICYPCHYGASPAKCGCPGCKEINLDGK